MIDVSVVALSPLMSWFLFYFLVDLIRRELPSPLSISEIIKWRHQDNDHKWAHSSFIFLITWENLKKVIEAAQPWVVVINCLKIHPESEAPLPHRTNELFFKKKNRFFFMDGDCPLIGCACRDIWLCSYWVNQMEKELGLLELLDGNGAPCNLALFDYKIAMRCKQDVGVLEAWEEEKE